MNEILQEAIGLGGKSWLIGAIVFLRVGAAMALLPGFSERAVPARVRLGLAFAFTMMVAPGVAEDILPRDIGLHFALICLGTETAAGLVIGLSLRLLILALETAGTIAAQSTSLAQMFPGAVEPMPVISHLLVWAGLCLAVIGGLHVRVCEIFLASYSILPVASLPDAGLLKAWAVEHVGAAFALAVRLAAPFFVISFLYNVALGVINRAMPQLMVAFVGAPAIAFGALLLLLLATPTGLLTWWEAFSVVLADPFRTLP
jgi:flagellar biosynthetic protein FliR